MEMTAAVIEIAGITDAMEKANRTAEVAAAELTVSG